MISRIKNIVKKACKSSNNYFGYEAWKYHIVPAVKYAKLMAKKIRADKEIVEIAVLLHDYAGIKDYKLYENHHLHGSDLAEKILKKYDYPKEKVEKVKNCILRHRGSKVMNKLTKEEICVADADSMAHFDAIPSLFYLAFFSHKMNIDEASKWLAKKLERSWSKLSPEAKEIIKNKYQASKKLFEAKDKL